MTKTIFASFYSRQEAENAINNFKNDILSDDNPVIIRDNMQTAENQTNSQNQNNIQNGISNHTHSKITQNQCSTQGTQGANNWVPPQMPYSNIGNSFNGYAQQNLYNGYTSGSTIGGLFGLATSAISMATIGAPYILTTTLANMFSYPISQNQMTWSANSPYPMSNYPTTNTCNPTGSSPTSDPAPEPQNNGVMVTLNVPEEKMWDVANSLKSSNAVAVRTS